MRKSDKESSARFDTLYREHCRFVQRLLARSGLSSDDVEDLAQQVWLDVSRRMGDIDLDRPMRPYLAGVVLRHLANERRRRRRRAVVLVEESETIATLSYDPTIRHEIEQAIPDPKRREAFLLHVVCGLPYAELVQHFGESDERLRHWVRDSQKRLRERDESGAALLPLPVWTRLRRWLERAWKGAKTLAPAAAAVLLLGPVPPAGVACSAPVRAASSAPVRAASSVAPVELHPDTAPEDVTEPAAAPMPAPANTKASPSQLPEGWVDMRSIRTIAQMQSAAYARRYDLVLELASQHEQQFPREQVRERLFERVRALCALGREAEARKIIAEHPQHDVLARACDPDRR